MATKDPKVDAYIAARAPFARPILTHLRAVIHGAHPGLDEALKWGMPSFLRGGKIVCGIAGFKAHCAMWFWHGATVVGAKPAEGMGNFGRITALDDLPSKAALEGYVRKAVALADERPSGPRARAKAAPKAAAAAKPKAGAKPRRTATAKAGAPKVAVRRKR